MENVTDIADSNKYGVDVPRGVPGRCGVQSCSTFHKDQSNVTVINKITMK
jgi:hypothetical protein